MELELDKVDPEVFAAVGSEMDRERRNLVMIASENYASRAVIQAQANVMTNKYAEGYPGSRYYGGCEYVDVVEKLAVERVRTLFRAPYANVQPHSGSQANMAVLLTFLEPGDLIMGMDLSHGGHLTHGSPVNFSGRLFRTVFYGLDTEGRRIDMDRVRDLALKHRPRLIIAGASAYPRIIDFAAFGEIAREIDAYFMVDMAHIAGLVAAGLHPSPMTDADFVTSTTHKTLRGPRGGIILAREKYGQALDKGVFPGIQGGPLMHIIAAKAVAFGEALDPSFLTYQERVVSNARVLAEELLAAGFDLVTGGTDNHLLLLDLSRKEVTGLDAERALGEAGIVANKNAVPFDRRGPKVTSGIRLGTPALTTRGMGEDEMRTIARFIVLVLQSPGSEAVKMEVREKVTELCRAFPVYSYLDGGR
ncbi:MAG: serine hydroxymethyltransferase [Deltaproteobacteria bacterium]|nr:serine hydroxymethyltransferase [Deltaproteobacteria bacterium]MBW1923728.1 serine hydroxymethyltransferase [Deltaproteobacteria bacterium]MBW1948989.1 serine hydroxymethyltransferase [Deltaproteobacteria bacterium]MBW2006993.1 serine hydroxymethyltransferase [Deltaproteobacteria bacterium]MBW2348769.1 serine hydroxymethyltransferase [Deltaproteobacteria bacterium]